MEIDKQFAAQFAAEWVDCWNTHNFERLMNHYTDDFTIQTPYALQFFPESAGTISGKNDIELYWRTAISKLPQLHFNLLEVFTGVNSISIYYHNTGTGRNAVENLFFNADGKVQKAIVLYN